MLIVVEGHKIDTKEIWDIKDINSGDTAGFDICLIGGERIRIAEKMPHDMYSYKRSEIKHKYYRLYDSVVEKWKEDMTDLEIFKL